MVPAPLLHEIKKARSSLTNNFLDLRAHTLGPSCGEETAASSTVPPVTKGLWARDFGVVRSAPEALLAGFVRLYWPDQGCGRKW